MLGAELAVGYTEVGSAKDDSHVPAGSGRKIRGTVSGILVNLPLSERKYSNTGTAEATEPDEKFVEEDMPVTKTPSTPAPITRTDIFPETSTVEKQRVSKSELRGV